MAGAKNRIGAGQLNRPTSSVVLAAVPTVDSAWVAQAIEARKLALRVYQTHLQDDLPSFLRADVCCSSAPEDASKLMADYLKANEKLFDLAAVLTERGLAPESPSTVDNSNGLATLTPLPSGRIEE
jgi:hypothetical protein